MVLLIVSIVLAARKIGSTARPVLHDEGFIYEGFIDEGFISSDEGFIDEGFIDEGFIMKVSSGPTFTIMVSGSWLQNV